MTESGESRQERAFASLEVAMAADPRINPFGMYAGDAPSGLTMFHWYASEEARFRAVAEDLPFVLDDDADDVSNEVRSVLASGAAECWPHDSLLAKLQDALEGVQRIHWFGKFADLCEGTGNFERSLRGDFRSDEGSDERPIAAVELDGFIEWLRGYGY
jgi:hypothetical protein